MDGTTLTISIFIFSILLGILGVMIKYWFEKINKGQDKIMDRIETLMEHRAVTNNQIDTMKEGWQSMQANMWGEIKELTVSMQDMQTKILVKVDKNVSDIQTLKSENRFIAKSLSDIAKTIKDKK
jgi:hypothetical protein